jgi:hypothetical protein
MTRPQPPARWYAERAAWRLIGLRYLPAVAGLNLAWEIAQLPLYTLWREASAAYIAFSVAHCTAGDAMIGMGALAVALVLTRAGGLARWHWVGIAALTALLAAGYTVFSEWMNVELLRNWGYSEWMPVLTLGGVAVGLSPLLQWILLPPVALLIARGGKARA